MKFFEKSTPGQGNEDRLFRSIGLGRFEAEPDLDQICVQINDAITTLSRLSMTKRENFEGDQESLDYYREARDVKAALQREHGDRLREYLKPYMSLNNRIVEEEGHTTGTLDSRNFSQVGWARLRVVSSWDSKYPELD